MRLQGGEPMQWSSRIKAFLGHGSPCTINTHRVAACLFHIPSICKATVDRRAGMGQYLYTHKSPYSRPPVESELLNYSYYGPATQLPHESPANECDRTLFKRRIQPVLQTTSAGLWHSVVALYPKTYRQRKSLPPYQLPDSRLYPR